MAGEIAASRSVRVLDLIERAVLAVLFAYFVYTFVRDYIDTGRVTSLILVVSESAVLVFVLLRRAPAAMTVRPLDWGLAFAGTLVPLLVKPGGATLIPMDVVIAIMVTGYVIQITAKLSLRRSFGAVAANRGIKVGGPYRFVRHPMYVGYVVTQVGFLIASPTAWNLAVYIIAWCIQLGRIRVEERLLLQDPTYREFAARVRYRLVPLVY